MSSHDGAIELDFGGEQRRFRLAIGQLRELQDLCKAGPPEIAARLAARRWYVDDLREIIRLGLVGGGTSPGEALRLVRIYVEERPLLESVGPALTILLAAIVGPGDDLAGKAPAGEAATDPTGGSPSPLSMETPRP